MPHRIDSLALVETPADWAHLIAHLQTHCGFSRCLAEVALLRHRGLSEKAVAAHLCIPYETAHARFRRIYREHRVEGVVALVLLVERTLVAVAVASGGG